MSTVETTAPLYDADGRPLGRGGLAFTDEQAVAITRREGPMLLSANAGSGKTAVLAERFVRSVIEDGCAPAQLLAITFTEKAAGELRSRIRRRFVELGAREAARDMDGAWISTIHGFCARILRAHAVTAGLDPAFVVLDEAVARQTRGEAYTTALAAFLAPVDGGSEPPAELELVATWGVDRLHDAIADVHDELRSTGHTRPRLPPAPTPPERGVTLTALAAALAAADAERAGWREGLKTLDAAHAQLDALGDLVRDAQAGTLGPGALAARLDAVKVAAQAKELKSEAVAALREAVAAARQAEVDREAITTHALLDRLLGLYADAYAAAKRARSAVDYDDLELLAKDLLAGVPAVATAYRERFERIMVDEFQDTNPLQLELLRHLDRDNVFLVGDALQSIYGFRHADVEVFRRERRRHQALDAAPTLAANWRSVPSLLQTVNAAFGPLHEEYVPLVAGGDGGGDAGSPVELLLVDAAHDDEALIGAAHAAALRAGMPQARSLATLAEARTVAARVAGLVAAGECAAGEVAILLRAAGDLHVFERALELEGLATLASGGRGYWLRQQVQDLTSYLAALANPLDEPALLGLLASPLVGVSADGLAALALTGRARGARLWTLLEHGVDALGLPAGDREAVSAFRAWFAAERAQAPLLPLDQAITRVVERTGYDLHVLGLAGGRRRLANVHKLERLAAEFEQARGRDVRGFIDHVAAEVQAEAREPEAPIELGDLDAVQLMTIHAAKGLEFVVVVVAGLGRQGQSSVPSILVHGDRVGLRLVRLHGKNADALDYAELKARVHAAQTQEERRIMHVAFTRAERRLIVSGTLALGKDLPGERPGGVPLGWIGRAVAPDLPHVLTAEVPDLEVDRHTGADRLRVTARLVAASPADVGAATPATEVPDAPMPPRIVVPETPDPTPGGEQLALTSVEPTAAPRRGRRRAASPAGAAPPAPAPPPPPATLSYSSLEDHSSCGYRYYLRRVLGLPEQEPPPDPALVEAAEAAANAGAPPPLPGLDPRVRGNIAHTLLEVLDDAAAATEQDVRDVAFDADAEVTDADVADLLALVHAWGGTAVAQRAARAVRTRREEPFAFPLDAGAPTSPLVNGFIDLIAVLEDGTWLVVDYKTNQVEGADLDQVVERGYATQRRIYALAALRAGAPRVEVVYVFLQRPDEPVISVHTAADTADLDRELHAQAEPLLAGRFPVAARPFRELCAYCPGRGGMCSWPQEMSLRPAPADVA